MFWDWKKPVNLSAKPIVIPTIKRDEDCEIDFESDTWKALVRILNDEKTALMIDNCNPNLDERATARYRGRIEQCEWILDLPKTTDL